MMNVKLTPQEWQLLSSYLDGQVTAREKAQIETYLTSDERYRQALEGLQRTRTMLRSVPLKRAPRNFTLTREMVAQKRPAFLAPFLRLTSAFASVAVVVIFTITNLLPNLGFQMASAPVQRDGGAPMSAEALTEDPMIIYWGAPAYGVFGRGGGDGNPGAEIVGGKGGGPAGEPGYSMPESTMPAPEIMTLPNTEPVGPTAATEEPPAITPTQAVVVTAEPNMKNSPPSLEGSDPILGIPDPLDQGKIVAQEQPYAQPMAQETPKPWLLNGIMIALAVIAVGAGTASYIFRKRF
ncbi:MAG: hypothetical protein HGA53_10085 [Anaerolineaceae bacterium]|nr:hypothetical protein [Anaerolineaceae bacterium]